MEVWVFNGFNSRFPSGIFSDREKAEVWIKSHNLTGVLTLYPLDQGLYEWAIKKEFFIVSKEVEKTPEFVQKFTSASQEHYHYENGSLDN